MSEQVASFLRYLQERKKLSPNTVLAYGRDLASFERFVKERGCCSLDLAQNTEVVAYLLLLKNAEKSTATSNRKLASIRSYFAYLVQEGVRTEDPTREIKALRTERKAVEYLTTEEIDFLLSLPDASYKGIRDKAMLELLYASGMRVGEVATANLDDLNLRIGFIVSVGAKKKARLVPLGKPARLALETYLSDSRPTLIREKLSETALFVNYNGERLTRQGIWKLLKEYAGRAGFSQKLTPQILRNSFAVHMLQNGADLKTLQELLGHEDILATQIYLMADRKKIKDVYDKTHPRA